MLPSAGVFFCAPKFLYLINIVENVVENVYREVSGRVLGVCFEKVWF